MENHLKMDYAMFDELNRKVSVMDIEIGEQDLVLRTDMDVPLSEYNTAPTMEQASMIASIDVG